jgi:hypothetical protein
MGFLKKLCWWKRKRSYDLTICESDTTRDIVTTGIKRSRSYDITICDSATTRNNLTREIGTQTLVLTCDVGTLIESNLSRDSSTQTTDDVPEMEEMNKKIVSLEKILEEKDRNIQNYMQKPTE